MPIVSRSATTFHRLGRLACIALVAAGLLIAVGCATITATAGLSERLSIRTTTGESWRQPEFTTALYSVEDKHHADVVLIDGTLEQPRYLVHMRLFFQPIGGATPMDDSATNCVVRIVSFEGDQTAIFGGGGMLYNESTFGGDSVSFALRETALKVLDATAEYQRPGFPIAMAGSISVTRDDLQVATLLREMQTVVRDRLGYPRIVESGTGDRALPEG